MKSNIALGLGIAATAIGLVCLYKIHNQGNEFNKLSAATLKLAKATAEINNDLDKKADIQQTSTPQK